MEELLRGGMCIKCAGSSYLCVCVCVSKCKGEEALAPTSQKLPTNQNIPPPPPLVSFFLESAPSIVIICSMHT